MRVDIEARREKVLRIIVNTYIKTGSPVSSRTICNKYKLGLCPASIRNVMSDLEERGYITHLHTSAGRVPTDKGYRFFVDTIMSNAGLTPQEKSHISREYEVRQRALEEVIHITSKVLSDFTKYTALVSQPELKRSTFKRIHFTPLTPRKICVTLITDTGMTKSSLFVLDSRIDPEKLQRIENVMNTQLEDVPLQEVRRKLHTLMLQERNAFFHVLKSALEFLNKSSLIDDQTMFHLEGVSNVLRFPEFTDNDSMYSLMQMLEQKMTIAELMRAFIDQDARRGVKVVIGSENPQHMMNDCALVLGTYRINERTVGGLGIIGPKRMDYEKTIAVVQYVSDMLSDILEQFAL